MIILSILLAACILFCFFLAAKNNELVFENTYLKSRNESLNSDLDLCEDIIDQLEKINNVHNKLAVLQEQFQEDENISE